MPCSPSSLLPRAWSRALIPYPFPFERVPRRLTVSFLCSNLQFSTKDVDNDLHNTGNCAVLISGGWWYHSCSWANLNGLYRGASYNTSYLPDGVKWVTFRGQYYSLKRTEMKLKPKP